MWVLFSSDYGSTCFLMPLLLVSMTYIPKNMYSTIKKQLLDIHSPSCFIPIYPSSIAWQIALRYFLIRITAGSPSLVTRGQWGCSWWCHQMETFSALLAHCEGNSPVTGEFPSQRPMTRSFHVFFDLRLYKRLSKQSIRWWFETPSRPLWRHSYMWLWNRFEYFCRVPTQPCPVQNFESTWELWHELQESDI